MNTESLEEIVFRLEEEFKNMRGHQGYLESKIEEIFKWQLLVDDAINEIRNEIEE